MKREKKALPTNDSLTFFSKPRILIHLQIKGITQSLDLSLIYFLKEGQGYIVKASLKSAMKVKDSLDLLIFLLQPIECWDYRQRSPCLESYGVTGWTQGIMNNRASTLSNELYSYLLSFKIKLLENAFVVILFW